MYVTYFPILCIYIAQKIKISIFNSFIFLFSIARNAYLFMLILGYVILLRVDSSEQLDQTILDQLCLFGVSLQAGTPMRRIVSITNRIVYFEVTQVKF